MAYKRGRESDTAHVSAALASLRRARSHVGPAEEQADKSNSDKGLAMPVARERENFSACPLALMHACKCQLISRESKFRSLSRLFAWPRVNSLTSTGSSSGRPADNGNSWPVYRLHVYLLSQPLPIESSNLSTRLASWSCTQICGPQFKCLFLLLSCLSLRTLSLSRCSSLSLFLGAFLKLAKIAQLTISAQ